MCSLHLLGTAQPIMKTTNAAQTKSWLGGSSLSKKKKFKLKFNCTSMLLFAIVFTEEIQVQKVLIRRCQEFVMTHFE